MIRVIVPSRTDAYLGALFSSMERSQPASVRNVTVADNGLSEGFRSVWWRAQYCPVTLPFCFSKAINAAVDLAQPDTADLLMLNDDTEIVTDHWLTHAEHLLAVPALSNFGMISFSIDGGVGNQEQRIFMDELREPTHTRVRCVLATRTCAFIAMLIRRRVWDDVGPMDERFVGYGYEDNDYIKRMKLKGWGLGITRQIVVKHGKEGRLWSSSFLKYNGMHKYTELGRENYLRFKEKWGDEP